MAAKSSYWQMVQFLFYFYSNVALHKCNSIHVNFQITVPLSHSHKLTLHKNKVDWENYLFCHTLSVVNDHLSVISRRRWNNSHYKGLHCYIASKQTEFSLSPLVILFTVIACIFRLYNVLAVLIVLLSYLMMFLTLLATSWRSYLYLQLLVLLICMSKFQLQYNVHM